MFDTLEWIPRFNPAKGERSTGLCRWGPTIILAEGASQAAQVFASWADLFEAGPVELRLTAERRWTEGDGESRGEFERLAFDREQTVGALRHLASYAKPIAAGGVDLYMLHLGI
jgi:hypothetical protein